MNDLNFKEVNSSGLGPLDSVAQWFKDQFLRTGEHRIVYTIENAHTKPEVPAVSIRPQTHYFRLWLEEMYLGHEVIFFKERYPAISSIVECTFGDKNILVPYLAGSANEKSIGEAYHKVVKQTLPMTTLMPFNGGTVKIYAALMAMKGNDFLNNLLGVIGDFSKLLVVPQLSAALEVAGPLVAGIQTLAGNGKDAELKAGFEKGFSDSVGPDNELRSGYILAIAADVDEYPAEKFWVVKGQLLYGDTPESSEPFEDHSYMLFRIEAKTERDDYMALESIGEPFRKAIDALGEQKLDAAEAFLLTAIVAAFESDELTRADRTRVTTLLREQFEEAKTALGLSKVVAVTAGGTGLIAGVPTMAEPKPKEKFNAEKYYLTPSMVADLNADEASKQELTLTDLITPRDDIAKKMRRDLMKE